MKAVMTGSDRTRHPSSRPSPPSPKFCPSSHNRTAIANAGRRITWWPAIWRPPTRPTVPGRAKRAPPSPANSSLNWNGFSNRKSTCRPTSARKLPVCSTSPALRSKFGSRTAGPNGRNRTPTRLQNSPSSSRPAVRSNNNNRPSSVTRHRQAAATARPWRSCRI